MLELFSIPSFDEMASLIKEKFSALQPLHSQWADLARRAVQGLPYNAQRLAELETSINEQRIEMRKAILVASEHFTEDQLAIMQKHAGISKYGWRSFKKTQPVTLRHGFRLIIN